MGTRHTGCWVIRDMKLGHQLSLVRTFELEFFFPTPRMELLRSPLLSVSYIPSTICVLSKNVFQSNFSVCGGVRPQHAACMWRLEDNFTILCPPLHGLRAYTHLQIWVASSHGAILPAHLYSSPQLHAPLYRLKTNLHGVMVQQLRVLAALPEDLGLISTHVVPQNHM